MNINRILFTGNLTADPELAQAGKIKVVNAALAGNECYYDQQEERQQITTFVDLKIWGAAAENFAKLARRGREIFVEGSLRQDRWEDDEGKKRSRLYVNVLSWQFTQRKPEESKTPANGPERKR
ncbi:MAG: single-stranded DNA-binding protein [Chthoniobacterales bacterium]